jgi:hypothetical protein
MKKLNPQMLLTLPFLALVLGTCNGVGQNVANPQSQQKAKILSPVKLNIVSQGKAIGSAVLNPGKEVNIVETLDNKVKISSAGFAEGWVTKDQIEVIDLVAPTASTNANSQPKTTSNVDNINTANTVNTVNTDEKQNPTDIANSPLQTESVIDSVANKNSNETTSITIEEKAQTEALERQTGMGRCHGDKTTTTFIPSITLGKDAQNNKTKVKVYAIVENKNETGKPIEGFPEEIEVKLLKESNSAQKYGLADNTNTTFITGYNNWKCACCKDRKCNLLKGYYAEVLSNNKVIASTHSNLQKEYKEKLEEFLNRKLEN